MLRVRDIMTKDVITLSPETTVREAMERLSAQHVSGAPVVTGTSVVGVVSTSDLVAFASTLRGVPSARTPDFDDAEREAEEESAALEEYGEAGGAFFSELWDDAGADVTERFDAVEGPEWNALEEHDVSEVMTRDLATLPGSAAAREAADMMRDRAIHRVLVVDDGELAGIVTALDIANAVADRRFTTTTYVFNAAH